MVGQRHPRRARARGVTKPHLILRFDAPLMSFGGVVIDNLGISDAWPSASLLAGLVGNALGFRRTDRDALQDLQDRLVFACRADQEGEQLRDFQTAELLHRDKGWTTRGQPEGREGGGKTYLGKHIRYRDYWADRIITVAMRLEPAERSPDQARIAEALNTPTRPLFIGRKPCLPAAPLFVGWNDGASSLDAVSRVPAPTPQNERRERDPNDFAAFAPAHDVPHPFVEKQFREVRVSGRRNWPTDVHGGEQRWLEGRVPAYLENES